MDRLRVFGRLQPAELVCRSVELRDETVLHLQAVGALSRVTGEVLRYRVDFLPVDAADRGDCLILVLRPGQRLLLVAASSAEQRDRQRRDKYDCGDACNRQRDETAAGRAS